jgi:hypothetical protein
MSTGTTVVIVVIAIIVIGAVAAVAYSAARRRRLQQRFGPEYDRAVTEHDSKLKAEAELARRERRVSKLDIKPLEPAARARYAQEWATIQEQFVDAPQGAVAQAQSLVVAVMRERGYPTDDQDQLMADLSVEHAAFLDHYRAASAISEQATAGSPSTEDLRQAMIHYRALFKDLLGEPADSAGPDSGYTEREQVQADREQVQADTDVADADVDVAAERARNSVAGQTPAVAAEDPEPATAEPVVDTDPVHDDLDVVTPDDEPGLQAGRAPADTIPDEPPADPVPPADTEAVPATAAEDPEAVPATAAEDPEAVPADTEPEHASLGDSIRRRIKR